MKISIYKLLGMVKDGNAPKRILYDNYIWSWTGDDYRTILKDEKEQFLITGMYYTWLTEFLNDTVEILEEKKKLPEKLKIEQDTPSSNYYIKNEYGTKCALTKHSKIIADKVNELLDYLESKGD